jgi:hypothetical protein
MITKRQLLGGAVLTASSAMARSIASQSHAPSRPGFFAAKDIAEAGLIFDLPIA